MACCVRSMKALEFIGAVIAVFFSLIPPADETDMEKIAKWRKSVSGFAAVSAISAALIALWIGGRLPGIDGVAFAGVLNKQMSTQSTQITTLSKRMDNMEQSQRELKLLIIRPQIITALQNQCLAINRQNQPALDQANGDLNGRNGQPGLLDQFRQLTGEDYALPRSCDAILISDKPVQK